MTFMLSVLRTLVWVSLIASVLSVNSTVVQTHKICFDIVAVNRLFNQLSTLAAKSGTSAWPPTDPKVFYNTTTQQYVLGLNLLVLPKETLQSLVQVWLERLQHHYHVKRHLTGSPFKQLVIMQNALGHSITNKTEYDFYPPIIPVDEEVKRVKAGHPVDYAPIDDPNINIIRYPQTGQPGSNKKYDLVVIVSSCINCLSHRYWARKTYMQPNLWGDFKVGFIFLVGMPATESVRVFDGYGIKIEQQPSYNDKVSREVIVKSLFSEADKYKDLLIGDFEDEFFNSTLRAMMGFRWATFFLSHQSPLFLFLDTEYSIIPSNVMRLVNHIPENSKPLFYGGMVHKDGLVHRVPSDQVTTLKWAVSEDEIPWERYPPYVNRGAIFVGSQAVIDATISMVFTRRFRLFDVYLGIVFYRLHYKPVHIPHAEFEVDKCSVEKAIGGHTGSLVPLIEWRTGHVK